MFTTIQHSLNNITMFLLMRSCSGKPFQYDAGCVHNVVYDIIKRQANEESKIASHRDHQILKVENQYFLWSFHVIFFCIDSQNSTVCIKPSFNFLSINKTKNIWKCNAKECFTLNSYFMLLQGGRQWSHFGGAKLFPVIVLKMILSSCLSHWGNFNSSKTFTPLKWQLIYRYSLKRLLTVLTLKSYTHIKGFQKTGFSTAYCLSMITVFIAINLTV